MTTIGPVIGLSVASTQHGTDPGLAEPVPRRLYQEYLWGSRSRVDVAGR